MHNLNEQKKEFSSQDLPTFEIESQLFLHIHESRIQGIKFLKSFDSIKNNYAAYSQFCVNSLTTASPQLHGYTAAAAVRDAGF